MRWQRWFWLTGSLLCVLAALLIACASGGKSSSSGGDDDTAPVDDDDNDDDDASPDDDDDASPGDDDASPNGWPGPPWFGCTDQDIPANATVVKALDNVAQYYNGDSDNKRQVDVQATFPAGNWAQVTLRLELGCPADGGCDHYDRLANIFLVQNPGANENPFELWRYITPFGTSMCMLVDITPFAAMLSGPQTIRSFIDTWVGPGSTGDGAGWTVSASFIFHPAAGKDASPAQIVNIWPYGSIELGNPDNTIATQIPPRTMSLPATISRAQLRLFTTGHGQGNLQDCGEFCELVYAAGVNDQTISDFPWRTDCHANPIGPNEMGTWTYPRDGWCPGAPVVPDVIDVTSALTAGGQNAFSYNVLFDNATYVNTCRPGAGGANDQCAGCAFDDSPGNCDYNSGDHTMPVDYLSAQLLIWE